MLDGAHVLVVKNDAVAALDLCLAIENANGVVVGPASTTVEALMLIANAPGARMPIAAAVLDADLAHQDVAPVVLKLSENGIPMIILSVIGQPAAIQASYPGILWLPKLCENVRVVRAVAETIGLGFSDAA